MPALKSPSVIVLDNASYHNIKTEETVVPNFNQRKADEKLYCFLQQTLLTCAQICSMGFNSQWRTGVLRTS
jgi:hypothetical protein